MDASVLDFGNGHAARVARPCQFSDVAAAVAGLGLRVQRPVLAVVGGAGGLDEAGKKRLFALFGHALVPVIVSRQAVVVDGGTDSGVMQLIGRARAAAGVSFPLVGVAAEKTIILPGDDAEPGDRAPLERNHSHFVLVPGSSWGDESPWLSRVATVIAGGAPSATILINGGEIAFQDVAHSLDAHRPVLAIAGTGRTADRIAAAVEGDRADEQAARLAGSPLITAVSWADDPAAVGAAVQALIGPAELRSRLQVFLDGFLDPPYADSLIGLVGAASASHRCRHDAGRSASTAGRTAARLRRVAGVRPSCSWRAFRGLSRAGIRSGGGPHRRLPPSVVPGSRRTSSSRRRSTRDPPRR